MPIRVAVIGGGAAGISALYNLTRYPDTFIPVAYERGAEVGGLWVYTDEIGPDRYGVPTSSAIYKSLRANTAKEVMGFVEYPMPEDYPTFPPWNQVLLYLQNYAKHFNLNKYIKFETLVTKVKPNKQESKITWDVTTRNLVTNDVTTDQFDAVLVCNGWTNPWYAEIPGRDDFQGQVMHSKHYRDSEQFKDKVIAVIGMSFSGMELMFKIANTAKHVYAIHNNYPNLFCGGSEVPKNITQKGGIREMTTDGIVLKTGEHIPCDVVAYATGYHYAYPFLQDGCNVSIEGNRVSSLYKHIYHTEHPTLCFLALAKRVLHMRMMSAQAAHVCKVLLGEITLPPEEEMRKDEEEDFQKRIIDEGQDAKMAHDLFGDAQWEYFQYLEGENGKSTGRMVKNYWNYHIPAWMNRFHDFQLMKWNIVDENTFTSDI